MRIFSKRDGTDEAGALQVAAPVAPQSIVEQAAALRQRAAEVQAALASRAEQESRARNIATTVRTQISQARAARDAAAARLVELQMTGSEAADERRELDRAEKDLESAQRLEGEAIAADQTVAALAQATREQAKILHELPARLAVLRRERAQEMAEEWGTEYAAACQALAQLVFKGLAISQVLTTCGAIGDISAPLVGPAGINLPRVKRGEGRRFAMPTFLSWSALGVPEAARRREVVAAQIQARLDAEGL
jgi:hypothetical protein